MAEGDSAGPPSPVQGCPKHDCKPIWDAVAAETAKTDGIKDTLSRNRAITASYAKLYLGSPEIRWAGVAAFASKQVGCAMTGALGGPGQYFAGGGNKAVYDELYPPLRFYQEAKQCGMTNDEIKKCLDEKPGPPLNADIKNGMNRMMNGDPNGGALQMLRHEQRDTLQQSVYDGWLSRRALDANAALPHSQRIVMSERCNPADGDSTLDFADYKGHIYNFADRWPFASDVANRFNALDSTPTTHGALNQSLANLATGLFPP